jgi:hypothetical protein
MKKETKYQYWSRIDAINPERINKYPEVKVGMCIEYSYKKEGRCEIVDFSDNNFKETWNFDLTYVCRTLRNMPIKEKTDILIKKLEEMKAKGDLSLSPSSPEAQKP